MNDELRIEIESATTAIKLVGLIPKMRNSSEEEISIFYDQIKKVTESVDYYANANILISNFVLSQPIDSTQNHNLKVFLLERLVKFDSSWKELLAKETAPQ